MRKVFKGKTMYAIFSGLKKGVYVQPCKVTEVNSEGFWANCHNGGDGLEFFQNSDIGENVFFSKDSAQEVIARN